MTWKKKRDTEKKPFWKKPLLINKKTIEQDLNDKDIQWITLDLYNPYENSYIISIGVEKQRFWKKPVVQENAVITNMRENKIHLIEAKKR